MNVDGDLRCWGVIRFVGWLLTPFVAWAVSFAGGWIGAYFGQGALVPGTAMTYVLVGSLLGALIGGLTWAVSLRWSSRQVYIWGRKHHLVQDRATSELTKQHDVQVDDATRAASEPESTSQPS